MEDKKTAAAAAEQPKEKQYPRKGVRLGGRQKGTKNKVKQSFDEMVQAFRDDNAKKAFEIWDAVKDPKDKVKLWIEISKIITPAPSQSVDLNVATHGYGDVLRKLRQESDAAEERREA